MIELELELEQARALYEALSRQWHNGVIQEFTTTLAEQLESDKKHKPSRHMELEGVVTDLLSHVLLELRRVHEIIKAGR